MKTLKRIGLLFLVLTWGANAQAQSEDKADRPSPPRTATAMVNSGEVTVDYSSPAVKGRTVWGDLVPYGKIWRAGANEATTITFQNDVTIDGNAVPAGKYAIFVIPSEKEWTVIINSVWDQWGSYNYDKSKDAATFMVKASKTKEMTERLEFDVNTSGTVTMMWEHKQFSFKVE